MWCLSMELNIQHRVIWCCQKVSLRICYIILFEYTGPWMLKTGSTNKCFTAQQISWCCVEKIWSVKKWGFSCSVTVSRLEFVSVRIAEQLQPNCLETALCKTQDYKTRLKGTMYSVVRWPYIFIFIVFTGSILDL